MLRCVPKRLRILISSDACTVTEVKGFVGGNEIIRGSFELDPEQPFHELSTKLATLLTQADNGVHTTIVLADEELRYFMVTPPTNATRFGDLQTATSFRFESLYGESSAGWQIDGMWSCTRPFLACAAPRALINPLLETIKTFQLKLVVITPLLVSRWNSNAFNVATNTWFISSTPSSLHLVAIHQGNVRAIQRISSTAEIFKDEERLLRFLEREAIKLQQAIPHTLYLAGPLLTEMAEKAGSCTVSHLSKKTKLTLFRWNKNARLRIDFAPRTWKANFRLTPHAVAIFGLGLALCTGAAYRGGRLWHQQQHLDGEIIRISSRVAARNDAVTTTDISLQPAQAKAINQAIQQLNLPWHALFNGIETATPHNIAILVLEPNAHSQQLRGTAEAPDPDTMLNYIEALKSQSPFDAVNLIKHEVNKDDPMQPLRFQFEAHWQERTP